MSSIIRCPKNAKNKYCIVPQSFCRDFSISGDLKSLLLYCFSLPDDWQYHAKHLSDTLNIKYPKCLALIKEGIAAGYIKRERTKNGNIFSGYRYYICDDKSFSKNVTDVQDNDISEEIIENDFFSDENENSKNVTDISDFRDHGESADIRNTESLRSNERYERNTEDVQDVQHIRASFRSDRSIPHFIKIKSLSLKDQQQLANMFSEHELALAFEDAKSYHKNFKKITNMAAFITSRAQEYREKYRNG